MHHTLLNCFRYISAISFQIELGITEIICCLCNKVVFLQLIGDCSVAWITSVELVTCMYSENCCAQTEHVIIGAYHFLVEILPPKGEQAMRNLQKRKLCCFTRASN